MRSKRSGAPIGDPSGTLQKRRNTEPAAAPSATAGFSVEVCMRTGTRFRVAAVVVGWALLAACSAGRSAGGSHIGSGGSDSSGAQGGASTGDMADASVSTGGLLINTYTNPC